MKILITGVAGFIGGNLAKRLLDENLSTGAAEGFQVLGIDNLSYGLRENVPDGVEFIEKDIRSEEIYPCFEGVDAVFHLAAKNCVSDCQADPVETADINVKGSVNVFEACRRAAVRKIIYAESSALYEGSRVFPTPESEVHPESFYARSKFAALQFARAYADFHKLNFTALRYFCVYGPAQDYRRTIPPVMSAFIIKLLKGGQPLIYGTGQKRRDFIYIDDVNDFHMLCLRDSRTDHRTFNLGSGVNHSVLEIYDMVRGLLGSAVKPAFRPDLPGEAETTLADITEARGVGWQPRTSLRDGLREAIAYINKEIRAGKA